MNEPDPHRPGEPETVSTPTETESRIEALAREVIAFPVRYLATTLHLTFHPLSGVAPEHTARLLRPHTYLVATLLVAAWIAPLLLFLTATQVSVLGGDFYGANGRFLYPWYDPPSQPSPSVLSIANIVALAPGLIVIFFATRLLPVLCRVNSDPERKRVADHFNFALGLTLFFACVLSSLMILGFGRALGRALADPFQESPLPPAEAIEEVVYHFIFKPLTLVYWLPGAVLLASAISSARGASRRWARVLPAGVYMLSALYLAGAGATISSTDWFYAATGREKPTAPDVRTAEDDPEDLSRGVAIAMMNVELLEDGGLLLTAHIENKLSGPIFLSSEGVRISFTVGFRNREKTSWERKVYHSRGSVVRWEGATQGVMEIELDQGRWVQVRASLPVTRGQLETQGGYLTVRLSGITMTRQVHGKWKATELEWDEWDPNGSQVGMQVPGFDFTAPKPASPG